jgi:hypothetical protein
MANGNKNVWAPVLNMQDCTRELPTIKCDKILVKMYQFTGQWHIMNSNYL